MCSSLHWFVSSYNSGDGGSGCNSEISELQWLKYLLNCSSHFLASYLHSFFAALIWRICTSQKLLHLLFPNNGFSTIVCFELNLPVCLSSSLVLFCCNHYRNYMNKKQWKESQHTVPFALEDCVFEHCVTGRTANATFQQITAQLSEHVNNNLTKVLPRANWDWVSAITLSFSFSMCKWSLSMFSSMWKCVSGDFSVGASNNE